MLQKVDTMLTASQNYRLLPDHVGTTKILSNKSINAQLQIK